MEFWCSGMAAGAGGEELWLARTQKESKENRRVRIGRNEGEEAALGSCSRESLQSLFPVPKLRVQGGKSLPGGLSHLGSCLTLIHRLQCCFRGAGNGGTGILVPPGLGVMCCATPCPWSN